MLSLNSRTAWHSHTSQPNRRRLLPALRSFGGPRDKQSLPATSVTSGMADVFTRVIKGSGFHKGTGTAEPSHHASQLPQASCASVFETSTANLTRTLGQLTQLKELARDAVSEAASQAHHDITEPFQAAAETAARMCGKEYNMDSAHQRTQHPLQRVGVVEENKGAPSCPVPPQRAAVPTQFAAIRSQFAAPQPNNVHSMPEQQSNILPWTWPQWNKAVSEYSYPDMMQLPTIPTMAEIQEATRVAAEQARHTLWETPEAAAEVAGRMLGKDNYHYAPRQRAQHPLQAVGVVPQHPPAPPAIAASPTTISTPSADDTASHNE